MFRIQRVRSLVLRLAFALVLLPVMGVGVAGATSPITIPACSTNQSKFYFDPGWFTRPTQINNQFLPLKPGTQLVLSGTANTGGVPNGHKVVFTITDLTKVINGVKTVVVWDRDFEQGTTGAQGQLMEAELSFWAQDREGNVWNLGEYPEEYDATGAFTGAPSTWIAGLQGAVPGIHMRGAPHMSPPYLQGLSKPIKFMDCAQLLATGQTVTVPVATYNNVLVTDETSPLADPNAHQQKYHAPGVGIVQIGATNDPEGETLSLTALTRLTASQLAAADEAVFKLDQHGHQPGVNSQYAKSAYVQK